MGGWVGGGVEGMLRLPANQVVCPVGQTDSHSSPLTTRHAVEQLETQATPLMPHGVCFVFSWIDRVYKKPSVKADLIFYSNIVTVDSA